MLSLVMYIAIQLAFSAVFQMNTVNFMTKVLFLTTITKIKKSHILWKDENLHNKNAEKDQTGAGNIVFEGRQGCCSVLEE